MLDRAKAAGIDPLRVLAALGLSPAEVKPRRTESAREPARDRRSFNR